MTEHSRSPSKSGLGRSSTLDGVLETYDHAIDLIDSTTPVEGSVNGASGTDRQSWRQLARHATSTSIKDQFARRKYAKWQQDRYDSRDEDQSEGERPEQQSKRGKRVEHKDHRDSEAVDFGRGAGSPDETRDEPNHTNQSPKKTKNKHKHKHKHKHQHDEEAAIDILYENQRGAFFCGIPLYSHSSLLNFDPAPWVTKDYKDSAVNITNAQVPDPSWQWAWKHWYVDMTEDVDEDGWQYSFAFFGKFAWHGTHPWFHSFCRRRRWLRKRIKLSSVVPGKAQPSSMSAAHKLNTDYFTIHSKRDRSPNTVDGRPQTARADSFMSQQSSLTTDEIPAEIQDIATLLKALRAATIDREKIDYIKDFVKHGGEELSYLKSEIPEIMHFLVFQNSRRQLLEFLKQQSKEAQDHRDEHDAEDRPEGEAESRKIDNLLNAVEAADDQIKGLEYWSDRKHVLKTTEDPETLGDNPLVTIFDKPAKSLGNPGDDDIADEIRGIASEAGIGVDPNRQTVYRGAKLAPLEEKDDKGKGKMKDTEDADEAKDSQLSPRSEKDQESNEEEAPDMTLDFSQVQL